MYTTRQALKHLADLVEQDGKVIKGVIWAAALSLPLWALIGFAAWLVFR